MCMTLSLCIQYTYIMVLHVIMNTTGIVIHRFPSLLPPLQVDAMIVGSHFKRDGKWYNDLDKTRVEQFMDTWAAIAHS